MPTNDIEASLKIVENFLAANMAADLSAGLTVQSGHAAHLEDDDGAII